MVSMQQSGSDQTFSGQKVRARTALRGSGSTRLGKVPPDLVGVREERAGVLEAEFIREKLRKGVPRADS
jgi:hypothetical protein